jgi:hypothetical protein
MRPICINEGCGQPCMVKAGTIDDPRGWRVHCGHCQAASYGKWPHREGVTPWKKDKCENIDGRLGFTCLIDWDSVAKQGVKVQLQLDHINGDSNDNRRDNVQTFCHPCHSIKTSEQGEFDGWRNYRAA